MRCVYLCCCIGDSLAESIQIILLVAGKPVLVLVLGSEGICSALLKGGFHVLVTCTQKEQ